jgi:methionine sulfoxide reductase heme-binding subunit
MDRLITTPPAAASPARGRREVGFGLALLAIGLAIGVAAGPASTSIGHLAGEKAFWTASRLTAFLAYLAFAGSTAYGLGMSSGLIDAVAGKPVSLALHRDLAWVGLALAAAHIFLLLGDTYIGFTVSTLLIPGTSPYLPVPVAIGQIAAWAALFTTLSFYLRARMGLRLWRGLHSLSAVVFALATAHGLFAGSDSKQDAIWWVYVAVSLVVLFLFVYRLSSIGGASAHPRRSGL